jgi:branched-chain amino acid transport system permease protein
MSKNVPSLTLSGSAAKLLRAGVLIAILFLVCTVAFRNPYYAGIITVTAIAAILTMAVNLSAYAGVLMFATGGLYGVGAYTYANLSLLGRSAFVALIAAAAMSMVVGFVIIIASLRLRGIYFALSTLIGNLILSAIFLNLTWLTAGPRGMSNIPPPVFWLPGVGDVAFVGYLQTYLVLAILVAWLFASWRILHTKTGIYLEAIRHDDVLSTTLGIHILKYRLLAFLPSAAMMGLAGGLYSGYTTSITPDNFDIFLSFTILTFVNVGGRGTFAGPIIAAVILSALVYIFQPIYMVRNLLYGSLLILVILISPDGIMGIAKSLQSWRRGYPR